jgi:hypothetical protein
MYWMYVEGEYDDGKAFLDFFEFSELKGVGKGFVDQP